MILLLDNYDSFVYNLDRYFQLLGQRTLVVRSDAVNVEAVQRIGCEAIVISPGPKTPNDAGCSLEVVRRLAGHIPILGVCLGHQAIGQALGGQVVRAPRPVHGQTSVIRATGRGRLLQKMPNVFRAARYHSLVLDSNTLPGDLLVTATTEDGLIMAVEHATWPLFGVQFHPESILTNHGYQLLAAFLDLSAIPRTIALPLGDFILE